MAVDADTCDKNVMNDGEAAFTADPTAATGPNAGIVEDGGLVQENTTVVNQTCKGNLIRMEIVET